MDKRIVYRNPAGGISIITPVDNGKPIEEIAARDVPSGLPFKIIDLKDLPNDRSERDRWDVDEADLTDGVGQ